MWKKFSIHLLIFGIAVCSLALVISWFTIYKRVYTDTVSNLTLQLANIRMIVNQRWSSLTAFKRYERKSVQEFLEQKADKLYTFISNLNDAAESGKIELGKAKEIALNYFKNYRIGKRGYIVILNRKGVIIHHPEKKLIGTDVRVFYFGEKLKKKANGSMFYIFEGERKIAAWRYFRPWDWKILLTAYIKDTPYILPSNFTKGLMEKTKKDIVNLSHKDFYLAIYKGDGSIVAYPDRPLTKDDIPFLGIIKKIMKKKEGTLSYKFNGKEKLKIFTYFKPFDWYIVLTAYPGERVMPLFIQTLEKIILYTVILFASIILIILLFTRKYFINPLMAIREGLLRISSGEYGYQIKTRAKGEIKRIIDTFNMASEKLKFHREEIEAAYSELAALNETLKKEQENMKKERRKLISLFRIALKTAGLKSKKTIAKTIAEEIKRRWEIDEIEISAVENGKITTLYSSRSAKNNNRESRTVPITTGKDIAGYITLCSLPQEVDEMQISTLSKYTGILFQLYDTIEELERQKSRLNLLSTAIKATLGNTSIEELFLTLGKVIVEKFRYKHMGIWEVVGNKLIMKYQSGYHNKETLQKIKEISINTKSIIAKAARTRNVQNVADVSKDPDYLEGAKEVKSELAIPIKRGKQVYGILNIESTRIDDFDTETQNLLLYVAEEIAIALENLKTLEKIRNHIEELNKTQKELKEKEEELQASMNQMKALAKELENTQKVLSAKNAEIEGMYRQTVLALVGIVEMKDPYTKGHSERVARLSASILKLKRLQPEENTKKIVLGGLFHDIGKVAIPGRILNKKGKLTPEEYDEIKKHPVIGAMILKEIEYLHDIIPTVLYHHERWDGNGYPEGLKGTEIPLWARIMAVADAFDAMTSDRPYRKGMSLKEALKEIERGAGTQFDPEIANLFIRMMKGE